MAYYWMREAVLGQGNSIWYRLREDLLRGLPVNPHQLRTVTHVSGCIDLVIT